MVALVSIRASSIYSWNSIQNFLIKIYHLKTQLQKRLNISLLNLLLKSTNRNILGHSLQGKLRPINYYLTNFQLILINLQNKLFF